MAIARIDIGDVYANIDNDQLIELTAQSLVNVYRDEVKSYPKFPGLTQFVDTGSSKAIEGIHETIDGTILAVSNKRVYRINNDNTATRLDNALDLDGNKCSWAEDGSNVYLANGGKLYQIDLSALTITKMGANTPSKVKQVVFARGFLLAASDTNWYAFNDLGANLVIRAMTYSSSGGYALAVATDPSVGGSVIFKSSDAGLNWVKVHELARTGDWTFPEDAAILSNDTSIALVSFVRQGAGSNQILRSDDSGDTWSSVHTQDPDDDDPEPIYRFLDLGSGTVWCGRHDGSILKSADSGATWSEQKIDAGLEAPDEVVQIVKLSSTVFLASVLTGSSSVVVYKSTDTGASWASSATVSGGGGHMVATSATNVLLSSLSDIHRSTDGGATFGSSFNISPILVNSGYDTLEEFHYSNSTLLAICTSDVIKSTDDGQTWTSIKTFSLSVDGEAHDLFLASADKLVVSVGSNIWIEGSTGSGILGDVWFADDKHLDYSTNRSWEFFNAEQKADGSNSIFTNGQEVFIGGTHSVEASWLDGRTPWAYLPTGFQTYGVLAGDSVAVVNGVFYYLGYYRNAARVIVFDGRQSQVLSTNYDSVISSFDTPSDAKGFAIVKDNKPFYVLQFTADDRTLIYNVLDKNWTELAFWNGSANERHLINSYAYSRLQNKHFVGDRRDNGKIHTLSGLTDDTVLKKAEIVTGHVNRGTDLRKRCNWLLIKSLPGCSFTLDYRDDGSTTFGGSRTITFGANDRLVKVHALGTYRQRQWRIVHNATNTDFFLGSIEENFEILMR